MKVSEEMKISKLKHSPALQSEGHGYNCNKAIKNVQISFIHDP